MLLRLILDVCKDFIRITYLHSVKFFGSNLKVLIFIDGNSYK